MEHQCLKLPHKVKKTRNYLLTEIAFRPRALPLRAYVVMVGTHYFISRGFFFAWNPTKIYECDMRLCIEMTLYVLLISTLAYPLQWLYLFILLSATFQSVPFKRWGLSVLPWSGDLTLGLAIQWCCRFIYIFIHAFLSIMIRTNNVFYYLCKIVRILITNSSHWHHMNTLYFNSVIIFKHVYQNFVYIKAAPYCTASGCSIRTYRQATIKEYFIAQLSTRVN